MPEPSPAKTNISIEMNSARAAFSASAWPNSEGFPMAILEIGIFFPLLQDFNYKLRIIMIMPCA